MPSQPQTSYCFHSAVDLAKASVQLLYSLSFACGYFLLEASSFALFCIVREGVPKAKRICVGAEWCTAVPA